MTYVLYGILVVALYYDIRSYKIPNALITAVAVVCATFLGIRYGPLLMIKGIFNAILIIIMQMPLYRLKALGAGDIKLFGVIAMILGIKLTGKIIIIALIFGAVLGILKILLFWISDNFHIIKSQSIINDLEKRKHIFGGNFHVIHFSLPMLMAVITTLEGWI